MAAGGYPVVEAVESEGRYIVPDCSVCSKEHHHSAWEGLRLAHCPEWARDRNPRGIYDVRLKT